MSLSHLVPADHPFQKLQPRCNQGDHLQQHVDGALKTSNVTLAKQVRMCSLYPKSGHRVVRLFGLLGAQQETSPLALYSKLFDHLIGTQQE